MLSLFQPGITCIIFTINTLPTILSYLEARCLPRLLLNNPSEGVWTSSSFAVGARCGTLRRRGRRMGNKNKGSKSNVPFFSLQTAAQEALTITHSHTQSTALPGSSSLFLPSLSLFLSLSVTLASSLPAHLLQPPPPSFSPSLPCLLVVCQTKCTHPLYLPAHYFLTFPPPHPLTPPAPWKQISTHKLILAVRYSALEEDRALVTKGDEAFVLYMITVLTPFLTP